MSKPRFRRLSASAVSKKLHEPQDHHANHNRKGVCQCTKRSCNCSSSIFVKTGRLVRQGLPRSVPDLRVLLGGCSHKLGLTDVKKCKKSCTEIPGVHFRGVGDRNGIDLSMNFVGLASTRRPRYLEAQIRQADTSTSDKASVID
jgi:hypothetical protein